MVFQTSDETWQAYNTYGGNSLYQCTVALPGRNPQALQGRVKVSYNRPFDTADDDGGRSWLLLRRVPDDPLPGGERLRRQLHRAGSTSTDPRPLLTNHKVFMSVGHDEYWSGDAAANVEAARDAGVNLAFFSGNEVFWKTRWEPSIDGSNTPNRTLVATRRPTSTRRSTRRTRPRGRDLARPAVQPAGGRRPARERARPGSSSWSTRAPPTSRCRRSTASCGFWRNTAVASLTGGQSLTLGAGHRHAGLRVGRATPTTASAAAGSFDMSSTTVTRRRSSPTTAARHGQRAPPRTT